MFGLGMTHGCTDYLLVKPGSNFFFKGAGRFTVKEKVGRVALYWMLSRLFSFHIPGINDNC